MKQMSYATNKVLENKETEAHENIDNSIRNLY